jgi:predicted acetyltransferase
VDLVRPTLEHLPSYVAALRSGWSADNVRGAAAAQDELRRIEADPERFLEGLDDPDARAGPVTLPDGSQVARLPGFVRWMWDGEFCGSIGLRWVNGTEDLPPHVLGHIGYAVVPWKRGRGYATQALRAICAEARARGLRWVTLTTDADNLVSQRVIAIAGGVLVERFVKPAAFGGKDGLRYRIDLAPS